MRTAYLAEPWQDFCRAKFFAPKAKGKQGRGTDDWASEGGAADERRGAAATRFNRSHRPLAHLEPVLDPPSQLLHQLLRHSTTASTRTAARASSTRPPILLPRPAPPPPLAPPTTAGPLAEQHSPRATPDLDHQLPSAMVNITYVAALPRRFLQLPEANPPHRLSLSRQALSTSCAPGSQQLQPSAGEPCADSPCPPPLSRSQLWRPPRLGSSSRPLDRRDVRDRPGRHRHDRYVRLGRPGRSVQPGRHVRRLSLPLFVDSRDVGQM